jgi:hypothetical protein
VGVDVRLDLSPGAFVGAEDPGMAPELPPCTSPDQAIRPGGSRDVISDLTGTVAARGPLLKGRIRDVAGWHLAAQMPCPAGSSGIWGAGSAYWPR